MALAPLPMPELPSLPVLTLPRPGEPTAKPIERRRLTRKEAPARFSAEPEKKSWWQWGIDFILRPGRAIRGAIYHATARGVVDPWRAAFRGFWTGLTGEEKRDFVDILRRAGMRRGFLRSAIGFVGDIASDPVVWVPGVGGVRIGALTKAGKLAKQATKIVPIGKGMFARGIMAGTRAAAKGITTPYATTWGAQARLGQRALVTIFRRRLIRGTPALTGMAKVGGAITRAPGIKQALAAFSKKADIALGGAGAEEAKYVYRALTETGHRVGFQAQIADDVVVEAMRQGRAAAGLGLKESIPDLLVREVLEDTIESHTRLGLEHFRTLIAAAPERAAGWSAEKMLTVAKALRDPLVQIQDDILRQAQAAGIPLKEYMSGFSARLERATALREKTAGLLARVGEKDVAKRAAVEAMIARGAPAKSIIEEAGVLGRISPRMKGYTKRLGRIDKVVTELEQRITTAPAYVTRLLGLEKKWADVLQSTRQAMTVAGKGVKPGAFASLHRRLINIGVHKIRKDYDTLAKWFRITREQAENLGVFRYKGTVPQRIAGLHTEVGKQIAKQQGVQEIIRATARLTVKNADDARSLLLKLGPKFGMFQIRPGDPWHVMAKGIIKQLQTVVAPIGETAGKLLRGHDTVLRWWKWSTLHMPPHVLAYTTRNAASDTLNAIAGEAFVPRYWGMAQKWFAGKYFGKAIDLTKKVNLGAKIMKGQSVKLASGEVVRLTRHMAVGDVLKLGGYGGLVGRYAARRPGLAGVYGFGAGRVLDADDVAKLVTKLRGARARVGGKLVGLPAGVDDASRIGALMSRLSKGDSIKDALFNVRKTLYDYADLTGFERKVVRRIFPFSTWARFNVPMQIARHAEAPGRLGVYIKLKKNIEDALGERKMERDLLPEWIKTRFGIQVGGNKDFPVFVMLGGFVPMIDLMDIRSFSALHQFVENQVGPLPKEFVAQWRNFEPFTRQEISRHRGETQKFLGMRMTRRVAHVLKNIRLIQWLDRYLKRAAGPGLALGGDPWPQALVGLYPYRASRRKWLWSKWYKLRRKRDLFRSSARAAEREKRPELAAERLGVAEQITGQMEYVKSLMPSD